MEILIQKDISKPSSRRVFAEFSTEVLTLEDVVLALREIIDDEKEGYHVLPFVGSVGESVERLDIYTSIHRRRADKAYTISNGRNTIYLLDYVVKAKRVYHDPIICIIGPDAEKIAVKTVNNLKRVLLPKICDLKINDAAITDFAKLTGRKKIEIIQKVSEVLEEAEVALKMKLLNQDHFSVSSERKDVLGHVSRKILEDIKNRKSSIITAPFDISEIISYSFVILFLLMILLAVVSRFL